MTDLSWTHLLILMVVALVVIGPKDLPRVMRTLGRWTGQVRAMAEQFRRNFDDMARESELQELREQVQALKNERPLAGIEEHAQRILDPGPVDAPIVNREQAPEKMNAPTPEDEELLEKSKAPLLEHLVELRTRIIRSLLAFFVAFLFCYYFSREIYAFLVQPLADALAGQPNRHLIFTALYETFFTYVKVGMFGAICLAFPYIAAQLWLFIAPGLYKTERRAFLPFLFASPVMFLIGASFVYYVMMPVAIRFFLGFESPGGHGQLPIELNARVSEYLSFVMTLIFGFGLCFQLPVLLTLLGRVGLVTSQQLANMRRYAVVGVFAVAAVLTPPDAFSMLSLAVPLVVLYEISILLVRWTEKKRAAEAATAS